MKAHFSFIFFFVLALNACTKDGGGEEPKPTPEPVVNDPGQAILIAPADNATCEEVSASGQVVFSWNSASYATTYDLKITNLNTQGESKQANISDTSKAVSLTEGTPYEWMVISKNSSANTTSSDAWRFYLAGDGIVNYAPFPASPISPVPGSTVTRSSGKISLSWEGSDVDNSVLQYTVYLDTVDGLQDVIVSENQSGSNLDVNVQAETIYYWRVKTSDGQNSSLSSVFSFKTNG
jgi:hypothetical protein